MLFRVNRDFSLLHIRAKYFLLKSALLGLDRVNKIDLGIEFSQFCVNTETFVHNLSFFENLQAWNASPGEKEFNFTSKLNRCDGENCSGK